MAASERNGDDRSPSPSGGGSPEGEGDQAAEKARGSADSYRTKPNKSGLTELADGLELASAQSTEGHGSATKPQNGHSVRPLLNPKQVWM